MCVYMFWISLLAISYGSIKCDKRLEKLPSHDRTSLYVSFFAVICKHPMEIEALIMQVANQIRDILTKEFTPAKLEIIDDSSKHAGHSGADPRGESHFSVLVVSDKFDGENRVSRQRLVYSALDELLKDRVHALALKTMTPAEYEAVAAQRNP
tara:strand:- start:1086 stop:1544 length:459 start_codon:yes stop_codon:yes gene_type:complete